MKNINDFRSQLNSIDWICWFFVYCFHSLMISSVRPRNAAVCVAFANSTKKRRINSARWRDVCPHSIWNVIHSNRIKKKNEFRHSDSSSSSGEIDYFILVFDSCTFTHLLNTHELIFAIVFLFLYSLVRLSELERHNLLTFMDDICSHVQCWKIPRNAHYIKNQPLNIYVHDEHLWFNSIINRIRWFDYKNRYTQNTQWQNQKKKKLWKEQIDTQNGWIAIKFMNRCDQMSIIIIRSHSRNVFFLACLAGWCFIVGIWPIFSRFCFIVNICFGGRCTDLFWWPVRCLQRRCKRHAARAHVFHRPYSDRRLLCK